MARAIMTSIVGKFQVTVPPEVREIYGLCEGDLFEWDIDGETGRIELIPRRAQLLTPQILNKAEQIRAPKLKPSDERDPVKSKAPMAAVAQD